MVPIQVAYRRFFDNDSLYVNVSIKAEMKILWKVRHPASQANLPIHLLPTLESIRIGHLASKDGSNLENDRL